MAKTKPYLAALSVCSSAYLVPSRSESSLVPNRPTDRGYEVGKVLAMYADEQLEGKPDERCKSCAFRPGTIPNGCEATIMDAVKCLLELNPFLCHEPRPHAEDGDQVLCAGYAALLSSLPHDATRVAAPWDYSYPEEDR